MPITTAPFQIVWPGEEFLAGYVHALEKGWSPDTIRSEAGREELERIRSDAKGFLALQVDVEGKGPRVTLPNGSTARRIPGYRKWMWDGEFCGVIGFRWQPEGTDLPPHVLGHIGFSVVPWKRRKGYATQALALLLPEAKQRGLAYVELTTDLSNTASQRVITANGGELVERFNKPDAYGGAEAVRYRITLR